jgi:hypothetical protein
MNSGRREGYKEGLAELHYIILRKNFWNIVLKLYFIVNLKRERIWIVVIKMCTNRPAPSYSKIEVSRNIVMIQ